MKNFQPTKKRGRRKNDKSKKYIETMMSGGGETLADRGMPGKRLRSNMGTCIGKNKYCPKRAKALAKQYRSGARRDTSGRGHLMNAYSCASCGKWHIGHDSRKH